MYGPLCLWPDHQNFPIHLHPPLPNSSVRCVIQPPPSSSCKIVPVAFDDLSLWHVQMLPNMQKSAQARWLPVVPRRRTILDLLWSTVDNTAAWIMQQAV